MLFHNLKIFGGVGAHLQDVRKGRGGRWTGLEKLCLLTLILAVLLVIAAPFLLERPEMVLGILAEQLVPWRL